MRFFTLCIIYIFSFCSVAAAQTTSTLGKEFYVSFNKIAGITPSDVATATLFFTCAKNTSGTIQNLNSSFNTTFSVTAGKITIVPIPVEEIVNDSPGIKNLGLFIQANDSIAAYGLLGTRASSDAATLIPVGSLGTEYLVASYTTSSSNSSTFFLLVATQDSTEVIITPSNNLSTGQVSGQPFSVLLNRGQSYYATHKSGSGKRDLSGSRISVKNPCKTIAVFSGSEVTYIPKGYPAGDLLIEQLFPIPSFGKQFITPALRGRNVYRVRVYAAYDNTVVDIANGAFTKTLNANELLEFESKAANPVSITTSQPAEVAAFAVSQQYDELFGPSNEGDPTMMLVPPIEQNLKESVFLSPVIGIINAHKLCIFAKTTDAGKTILDNQNVGSSFIPVDDNPIYSFATFDVQAGQHIIKNDGGFLAYSYGFGNYQGYGYCSGSSAKNIETYLTLNGTTSLSGDTADACIKDVNFEIVTSVKDSAYTWDFGDGSQNINNPGNQLQQQHNYQLPGIYEVKLTRYKFGDASCNISSSVSRMQVKIASLITPAVKVVAIPSTPVCEGTGILFIAQGTGGGPQPKYQWKINGVNAGTNSPTFSSSILKNGDSVGCEFTSSFSCAGMASVNNVVEANVIKPLSPAISIATASDSLCSTAPVTFSLTTNITTVIPGFQWLVNGKNAGNGLSTFTFTPSNGDEISCQVNITDACGNKGQAISNIIKITIAQNLKPAITISSPLQTICDGGTQSFTASAVNTGSAPLYQWQVNGLPAGDNNMAFSSSTLKNGDNINALLTTTGWCPLTSNSNTIKISAIPVLVPAIEIASLNTNVCQGAAISFTSSLKNGGGNPTLQWQINGVAANNTTASFSSVNFRNGDIISCILTANNVCQTSPIANSNLITVTVNPIVIPVVVISASKNPVCQGEEVVFKAAATNTGTGFGYQWNINGNNLTSETGSGFTTSNLIDGTKIICKIISGEMCTKDVVSNPIVMVINPLPTVAFNPEEVIIYSGTSFTMAPIITGNIANYRWTPSMYLSNTTLANPVATPVYNQYYTLEVSTTTGCRASAGFQLKVFRDVVMPNAFTPNSDGKNDFFRIPPIYQNLLVKNFVIFNRWGQKIFETSDVGKAWNGAYKNTPQPAGNYVWMLEYNNPITRKQVQLKGSVILIR